MSALPASAGRGPATRSPTAPAQARIVLGAAVIALLVGALVYAVDRGDHSAYLLPRILLVHGGHQLFGPIAQWLPSFVHAFAFSLLTAALLPHRALPMAAACLAWGAIDAAVEIAQHKALSGPLASAVPQWFARVPVLDHVQSYLRVGVFDPMDLAAIAAGCLAAFAVSLLRPAL